MTLNNKDSGMEWLGNVLEHWEINFGGINYEKNKIFLEA
jgi:hypothetical protein